IMGVAERFPALKEYVGDDPAGMKIDPKQIRQLAPEVARRTMTLTAGMLGAIVNGILILFLATYFVIEANDIWPKLLRWLPHGKRERFAELILPLQARMGGYVRGQILVSIAVATFLAAGLSLLGVNNGLVLGALAGLFNIVPFVGSMISLVLSVVVALNQSVLLGGLVVGLFAVEQWLESSFITPHLLGRQVDLHPLIVLFAILIGGTIMGVPGALVAVPAAAALTFLAQEFYLKPLNGETTVAEEAAAAVAASDSAEAEEAAAPPDTTNAP
ncbi:MAG TPA: AI-2E family transporter, partial [Candidatus Obscuribacterales bacterium]